MAHTLARIQSYASLIRELTPKIKNIERNSRENALAKYVPVVPPTNESLKCTWKLWIGTFLTPGYQCNQYIIFDRFTRYYYWTTAIISAVRNGKRSRKKKVDAYEIHCYTSRKDGFMVVTITYQASRSLFTPPVVHSILGCIL